jgi:hypothetical protein
MTSSSMVPRWLRPPSYDAPIDDIRRNFAYLRIAPFALPEVAERQRYEYHFQYYRVLVSGAVALAIFVIGASIVALAYPNCLCRGWPVDLWPWNATLLANVPASDLSSELISASWPIVSVNSWAVIVWLPWLIFSVISELRRRDHYIRLANSGSLVVIGIGFTVLIWWMCSWPLVLDFLAYSANLREPFTVGAAKKGFLMSVAAAGTGVWLMYLDTVIFHQRPTADISSIK